MLSDSQGFHFLRKISHELSCNINDPFIKVNWFGAFVEILFINKSLDFIYFKWEYILLSRSMNIGAY